MIPYLPIFCNFILLFPLFCLFFYTSFVSEKNTNVESVQFVIKTDGIKIDDEDDAETAEASEEESGFWQKLLGLFR